MPKFYYKNIDRKIEMYIIASSIPPLSLTTNFVLKATFASGFLEAKFRWTHYFRHCCCRTASQMCPALYTK